MIIPVFHLLTSQYPIAASTTIEAGMLVNLDDNGYAIKAYGNTKQPVGIAADQNRAAVAFEWVNRVPDFGNETAASGMLSVYHSGGEFLVDMDDGAIQNPAGTAIAGVVLSGTTTTPGTILYSPNAEGDAGKMTSTGTTAFPVAMVLSAAASLDGGIPGEYEPLDFETVSGTPRTWIKIKLLI